MALPARRLANAVSQPDDDFAKVHREAGQAQPAVDGGIDRLADVLVEQQHCDGRTIERGRRVAEGVRALAVPGSGLVRAQAEAEGLDKIFSEAGFEWRQAGCSMCVGMNGDTVAPGQRSASTSNRNFQGRQGPGARTHLMSPAMAAAAAVTGHLADVRTLLAGA